jgi:peptidyl-prolyl cis-trans isomerase C
VTINTDYLENSRNAARARIDAIARMFAAGATGSEAAATGADADSKVRRFGDAARRHSECPTALEDGRIGDVHPGQLYPAVDAALFALAEGAISPVVESPMGFHLVLCERIKPAKTVPFAEARGRIREALERQRRREAQRAWLAELGVVRDTSA